MPQKILLAGFLIFFASGPAALANADTAAQIQALQEQIRTLQQQLDALRGQTSGQGINNHPEFTKTLRRGSRDPEVRRLQEFLSAMPDIYPEGLATGYFGLLTEAAVKRFQKKFNIDAAGITGPKTRIKLNELAVTALPPQQTPPTVPSPAPEPITPPTPALIKPVTAPAATATPPTQPAALPTSAQLGFPIISFYGWKTDSISVQFTHDPGSLTRTYAIYLKNPDQNAEVKYGQYTLPPSGETKTAGDGTNLKNFGPVSWEWEKPVDFKTEPAGIYTATVAAVGDGDIESQRSPARSATLYSAPTFENLLEGTPARDTMNNNVRMFPITMSIRDGRTDLYYRYVILDGQTKIWESGFRTNSITQRTVFANANSYAFDNGKTYRIRIEGFDNNTGANSQTKQAPGELAFVFAGQ